MRPWTASRRKLHVILRVPCRQREQLVDLPRKNDGGQSTFNCTTISRPLCWHWDATLRGRQNTANRDFQRVRGTLHNVQASGVHRATTVPFVTYDNAVTGDGGTRWFYNSVTNSVLLNELFRTNAASCHVWISCAASSVSSPWHRIKSPSPWTGEARNK